LPNLIYPRRPNRVSMLALAPLLPLAIGWALAGCAPGSTPGPAELTASFTAPVTTPGPTAYLGPTPLPPPTLAQPPDATPTGGAQVGVLADPGISIQPQTGEPGDVVMVTGTGWPPNAPVLFHWGPPTGPTGRLYYKLSADATGAFSVGLIVPPRSEWPTYLPAEFTILQLRATTPSIYGRYFWASFTYIPRPTPTVNVAKVPTATVTCPTCW